MLKQLINKEEGIVFVTVLMIIVVMMILSVGIISMNVSQVMLTEGEVKRIQAEVLATGGLMYLIANQQTTAPGNSIAYQETLDNTAFSILANRYEWGTGTFGTDIANIYVTY